MTTIPDDVMEEARYWTAGWEENGHHPLHLQAVRQTVARAILAERERCAKVADRWKHHDTGYDIAAAIRSQP